MTNGIKDEKTVSAKCFIFDLKKSNMTKYISEEEYNRRGNIPVGLLKAAQDFLKAIDRYPGYREKLSDILDTLDPQFKEHLTLFMIRDGNQFDHIRIKMQLTNKTHHQKIEAIKVIRSLTGFGLKEAKDLVEHVIDHHEMVFPFSKNGIRFESELDEILSELASQLMGFRLEKVYINYE